MLANLALFSSFKKYFSIPLDTVLANSERLLKRAPLQSLITGNTELCKIDAALHQVANALDSAEDILHDSRLRVHLLMESLPVSLIVASNDGIIETTNISTEQVFGYRQSNLSGLHLSVLFIGHNEWQSEAMDSINANFVGRVRDLDAVRKDGSRVPVELSIARFEVQGEQKLIIAALDVTARREMEQFKQEFTQMVSHDLRSPLTALLLVVDLLQSNKIGELTAKGREMVDQCHTDVDRMIALIDDLLDLEKLQAGRMKMRF